MMLNPDEITDLLRRSTLADHEALRRRAETPRLVVDAVLATVHEKHVGDGGPAASGARRQGRRSRGRGRP